MQSSSVDVNEKSTAVFGVSFTDSGGSPVTPDSITWTLTDASGAVINSRSNVSVSVPASSIVITLTGNDLALSSSTAESETRVLTINAVYDSVLYGNDLPFKDDFRFNVRNLVGVS